MWQLLCHTHLSPCPPACQFVPHYFLTRDCLPYSPLFPMWRPPRHSPGIRKIFYILGTLLHRVIYVNLCNHFVLVFHGCYSNLPQTVWLKATEIYSFTVLMARSLKSRCQPGCAPSGALGESPFLASSQPLVAHSGSVHGGLWLVVLSVQPLPLSHCMTISSLSFPLPSLLRTPVIGFNLTWVIQGDLISKSFI